MINKSYLPVLLILLTLTGCYKAGSSGSADAALGSSAYGVAPGSGSGNPGNPAQAGVITAGEWNDLDHWLFWDTIIHKSALQSLPEYWHYFHTNRISVTVMGTDSLPVSDAPVKLVSNGTTIFSARTDNKGKAELWPDLHQNTPNADFSKLTIDVNNGASITNTVKPYIEGINRIVVSPANATNKIEIAFTVDATGSMGDELEYLKTELLNVITRVKNDNPKSSLSTSAVFYRDEKDDYVTRVSGFTSDINSTISFIKNQSAGGGGDFPEAVHTALDKSVNQLQWSANAKARLIFLLLDAPPHHTDPVISDLQASVAKAAEKGIKIIPITASGIDKETEFLMRFLSLSTNGTYVFITNHSGIGNPHLEATVGPYTVEFLNNLMVRLINKYAQ